MKLSRVKKMNDEFRQKLLVEIDKSGFSHELNVIQELRNRDFTVFPNLSYVDAEDKPHEIDAYAILDNFDRSLLVRLNLIVECKVSKERPWVFFEDPWDPMAFLGLVDRLICFSDVKMQESLTPLAGCMNSALSAHHYNEWIPKARTYFEAFGKDAGREIYQGVSSLWYAIDYFRRLFERVKFSSASKNKRMDFIHPVIVFKGNLIVASRTEDSFELQEVPHVILRTIDAITDKTLDLKVAYKETLVDIIRDDYLEDYIQKCKKDLDLSISHSEQLLQAGWIIRDEDMPAGASSES
jgi:hypothetical protein